MSFSFRVLLPYPSPSKDRKNVAAEFPGAIRWTFCRGGEVNRSHSTDPSGFCLEEEEERGERVRRSAMEAGGRGKSGRVLEERTALASVGVGGCRIHPLSPPLPSIRSLFPLYGRASGQFEITLSPFQCVQSKLQFKSSLAGTPEL